MTNTPTPAGGPSVVIVTQPVTEMVNTALRSAGYEPDTSTPECVIYMKAGKSELWGQAEARPDGLLNNRSEPRKLLLTPEEAAEALSIGRTKIYQLLSSGFLPSVRIGACRRIPIGAISDLIADLSD
jgi:excisionase family DNA binding protein